jgi:uncharacterized integral membrane protein (TIGR00697 family)
MMTNLFLAITGTIIILSLATGSVFLGKRYGISYVIATVAALVIVSNIVAIKIITLGPLTVPAAIFIFPATFLVTDILTEKWGPSQARRAVWAGFYANLVVVSAIFVVLKLEPAPFAHDLASSFDHILGMAPRIVIASLIAYLVSQHHDIFAFEFWRRFTNGRLLIVRNTASTTVSQLIDTILFITIAFGGQYPLLSPEGIDLVSLITGQYIVKLIISVLDTPFVYLACNAIDKIPPQIGTSGDPDWINYPNI